MFDETVLLLGLCFAALALGIHLVFVFADAADSEDE